MDHTPQLPSLVSFRKPQKRLLRAAGRLFGLLLVAFAARSQYPADPDAVCATCHRTISETYRLTPMARTSGSAREGLAGIAPGGFRHAASGIDYKVFLRDSQRLLTYDRALPALHGAEPLEYFVGSNQHGRTFLYREGLQWFEAPINYYSRKAVWDMAPAYGGVTSLPAPLPVDANCLHCHATAVQKPLPAARNRFAAAPFLQAGVGCAACHGDPTAHLAAKGHGPIVNPGKLPAARRDSACLTCHLEGDAAVFRANTSPADFRPGDDLDRYAVYFVKASSEAGGGRAASQWEALLRSACRRGTPATATSPATPGAGDALTCTTCHDPHSSPAPAERVAYFRAKCLNCHNTPAIALEHFPAQPDCASCHMPTRSTVDISHNQSVDHNIQRVPSTAALRFTRLAETTELIPVQSPSAPATVTERELGLAYAQLGARGDRHSGVTALRLLEKAEAAGRRDTPVEVQLGFLYQRSGDAAKAVAAYEAALRTNPFEPTALGNLAVLDAVAGRSNEAVTLLTRLLGADPSQTAAGLNLAFIQCRLGDKASANRTLEEIARLAPDDPALRSFRESGSYGEQICRLQ